jgi:outer membrane lipoprotein-sorting protein
MIARTLSIALAVAVLGVAPDARDQAGAAAVYARMQHVNAALKSYEATVHVDVAMHSFPFISPKLDGEAFFKRPDRNAVVFNTVPALASAIRKIYPQVPPPAEWDSLYVVTPVSDDGSVSTLRLVPRKHGRVDHIDVEADDKTATATKFVWNYEDGGSISLAQEFANVDGAYVVSAQSGKVDLPSYKADVASKFSDYKLNVAVDDKVFEDAK